MEGRIEENEYAYVDEFPFVPRPQAVLDNTLNHRRDCEFSGNCGYTEDCGYTATLSHDPGIYSHDHNLANQMSHNRSHSVGSMDGIGDPPKYFTLDPEMAPNTSCLPANLPVKLNGGHGSDMMDNRYEIQDTFPRKLLTFKSDPGV